MVENITITLPNNETFTMNQNDWENAPIPICCALIDKEGWEMVSKDIQSIINNTFSSNDETFDTMEDMEDLIWETYENSLLSRCKVFYYEDMSDEEYETLKSLDKDTQEYLDFCLACNDRIEREVYCTYDENQGEGFQE